MITDTMTRQQTKTWERYESVLLEQGYWIEENFNDYFKDAILPMVAQEYEQDGIPDVPARREAYNNQIDALVKGGGMTEFYANEMGGIPDELEELVFRIRYVTTKNPIY
tara:strand:+ start:284 stop:610 length:327 start_codon:yes stop_codon:yes gene_type:complete